MSRFFRIIVLTSLLFLSGVTSASEDEGTVTIGVGKAIEAVDIKQGFKLSEKAINVIGVETMIFSSTLPARFPVQSFMTSRDDVGIYRRKGAWFKLVPVKVVKRFPSEFLVESRDLNRGDEIVIKGVPLLRAAELEAFSGGEAEEH